MSHYYKIYAILSAFFLTLSLCIFCFYASTRSLASLIDLRPKPCDVTQLDERTLPFYTLLVALYDEAEILPQLITNLSKLDYPHDRLEILILLEEDDIKTQAAFRLLTLEKHIKLVTVPQGSPKTKPRALNYGLRFAKGSYVGVYDAEDRPDPLQLKEAVWRFLHNDARLICLQAPLRPVETKGFIAKQFRLEYWLHFEHFLPMLDKFGSGFPLGGTSNHFKVKNLREIGAWDAHNVTEDADLGFRILRAGYLCAMMSRPTYEHPPTSLKAWLPQRTRWIKGHIQTVLVALKNIKLWQGKQTFGLFFALALGVFSSLIYGFMTLIMLSSFLMGALLSISPNAHTNPLHFYTVDTGLFLMSHLLVFIALARLYRHGGPKISLYDLIGFPLYWALQSLAALFALWQLLTKPFYWDKTPHNQ